MEVTGGFHPARWRVFFSPVTYKYVWIRTKHATKLLHFSPLVSLRHAGVSWSSVLVQKQIFGVSHLYHCVCALTLWNTESGLWSRSPLLVTESSAAELRWVSSAMVLSYKGKRGKRKQVILSKAFNTAELNSLAAILWTQLWWTGIASTARRWRNQWEQSYNRF